LRLAAAHLDHGLDPDSAHRAGRAAEIADQLGVALRSRRIDVEARRLPGESLEEAARRERYAWLRQERAEVGAEWIAVGHHRGDQVETVLLRLLFGTGVIGLGGMREVQGDLLRPMLAVDRLDLARSLEGAGFEPVFDPGNDDLARPRNRLRHALVPRLSGWSDFSAKGLLATARAARGASDRLLELVSRHLEVESSGREEGRLSLEAFRQLPASLRPFGLDSLRRAAGAPYAAGAGARKDLERQLAGSSIGCDCGDGWVWQSAGDRLVQKLRTPGDLREFSYTLRVPGELSIPEIGLTLRMSESKPAPWMFQGSKSRAAMSLPLEAGQHVLIRSRKPGDRVRPLGCDHVKKLKDVLIDRHIARERRDALPLVIVDDRIAWVPGVTIDDSFRIDGDAMTWVAELIPTAARTP